MSTSTPPLISLSLLPLMTAGTLSIVSPSPTIHVSCLRPFKVPYVDNPHIHTSLAILILNTPTRYPSVGYENTPLQSWSRQEILRLRPVSDLFFGLTFMKFRLSTPSTVICVPPLTPGQTLPSSPELPCSRYTVISCPKWVVGESTSLSPRSLSVFHFDFKSEFHPRDPNTSLVFTFTSYFLPSIIPQFVFRYYSNSTTTPSVLF